MSINTVYAELVCPFCEEKITSGVGFRIGALKNAQYKVGQKISWDGAQCRPSSPVTGRIKSIGYFNCDNIKCKSWSDCYPEVQQAVITIDNDVISDVQIYTGKKKYGNDFDIIEPKLG